MRKTLASLTTSSKRMSSTATLPEAYGAALPRVVRRALDRLASRSTKALHLPRQHFDQPDSVVHHVSIALTHLFSGAALGRPMGRRRMQVELAPLVVLVAVTMTRQRVYLFRKSTSVGMGLGMKLQNLWHHFCTPVRTQA